MYCSGIENDYLIALSIVPIRNFCYGLNNASRSIYRQDLDNLTLNDDNSKIIEFQLTVINFRLMNFPIDCRIL